MYILAFFITKYFCEVAKGTVHYIVSIPGLREPAVRQAEVLGAIIVPYLQSTRIQKVF